MSRLFLAVWPPPEVVEALERVPRPDESGVRLVAPDKWHVTLRFLGPAEPSEVTAAMARAALPAAVARVGPAIRRLGQRVIVAPVDGLDDLAAVVVAATTAVGEPPDPRGFSGHLTLARLKKPGAATGLVGAPFDAAFRVDEVTLVDSSQRAGGLHYEILGRWPSGSA